MKKILLFTCLTIAFFACKKTESTDDNSLNGEWISKSITADYFDASNKKIFTETDVYETIWVFSLDQVTLTVPSGSDVVKSKFAIQGSFIVFANKEIGVVSKFEITSRSEKSMNWAAEDTGAANVTYFENGVSKKAAKVIISMSLNKRS